MYKKLNLKSQIIDQEEGNTFNQPGGFFAFPVKVIEDLIFGEGFFLLAYTAADTSIRRGIYFDIYVGAMGIFAIQSARA